MHRNGCESGIDTQPPHTLGAGNITLNTAPSPLAAAKPAAAPIGPGPSIVLTRELRRLGAARDTSLRIERARKYKSEWREPGGGGMQSSEAAARRRTANRERRGPPPPARRRRGPRAPEAALRPLRGAPAHGPRGSAERDAAPRAFARLFRSAAAPSAAPLPGGGRPGGGAGCRGVPAPARRRAAPRPAAALTVAVPGAGRGVRLLRWDQFSRGGVPPAGGLRGGGAEGVGAPLFPVDGKGQGGGCPSGPPAGSRDVPRRSRRGLSSQSSRRPCPPLAARRSWRLSAARDHRGEGAPAAISFSGANSPRQERG
ncbi:translation initiation factor IF-2-like [Gallus gallus]|uniref:translation initiation factor IF-2-like n=1 Tax=Gallus gallus TaxID=9031 RepID=UPI001AE291A6|nr:translation initiation factor IF-2-like [Gallus gallus]XP_040559763.1 translation initiation factor IF-2-like [Gallus gallus]